MHTMRISKKERNKTIPNTEAILSNEDRKLKFETSWNGYDTQMRREVKTNRKKIYIKHRHTT